MTDDAHLARAAHNAASAAPRVVSVPGGRFEGWVRRYQQRHPGTEWTFAPTSVTACSADGSTVQFDVPVSRLQDLSMDGLLHHLGVSWPIGVVLVRRGGFAVARVVGEEVVESKIGQRHVQGRSKAGGWSQQRFARRRDNQAKIAFTAAGDYVEAILAAHSASLNLLVLGGDKAAVDAVLAAPELAALRSVPQRWLPGLPNPRRNVLNEAITSACSLAVCIVDTAARNAPR